MRDVKNHIRLWLIAIICIASCKHKADVVAEPETDGFPPDISSIFINRCATAGCHNEQSHTAAGDLRLDSWSALFESGVNGAVVVPYSIDNSSLLYFINTHAELGPIAEPQMPLNNTPLSKEEYLTIRNWVANGAPDKNGNIPFASNAGTRQKIYMTMQGCDLVAVIDAEKKVVMRYIPVGKINTIETPDHIVVSPDGMYAYVSFWNGNYIQKIDTRTDKVTDEVNMGNAYWKALQISDDGTKLAATSWRSQNLVVINTATMQVDYSLGGGNLESPEAIMANDGFDTFYVSSLFGNTIYKLAKGYQKAVSIDANAPGTMATANSPDPYRIVWSPDRKLYFISCQNTDEVRVMDAATDKLITTITTGKRPQEMVACKNKPYLIVTCMGDTTDATSVGSVQVINYKTYETVQRIEGKLFQPYGIAVDEKNNQFIITNRNQASKGPSPHHSSPCSGRNGYYMVYDLNTLAPVNGIRYEVSVDPYATAIRFR